MNPTSRIIPLAIGALLVTAPALPVLGAGPRGAPVTQPVPVIPVIAALNDAETATLIFMRTEERFARDSYVELGAMWPVSPFGNIALAEQTHLETLEGALARYGVADPADPPQLGSYNDTELDALYDQIATGSYTYLEALAVGAHIEELDILDLQAALTETDHPDLQNSYNHLLRGSRNHLRAFVAEIVRQGGTYTPRELDPAAFEAIVSTPRESGGTEPRAAFRKGSA